MKTTSIQRAVARNFLQGRDLAFKAAGNRTVKITEKKAEAWACRTLFVAREYNPVHDGRVLSITYREGITVGPRGGKKTVYSSIG